MFSHIMLGTNDIARSKKFYDATFAELGIKEGVIDEKGRCFYITDTGIFSLTKPINGEAATAGNGSTIGFNVTSAEQGDKWHAAGIANGGTSCENPPGIRKNNGFDLYLAYLRDPDGNKICALKRTMHK
ncbi:VOC family protein [Shewanella intestini]|uniref:VOC family protein n=1 Tax=Shewanella intestini TaxID=2017544 RepID=A0ABS5I373_9GAMM|nr:MULTISPECIES: VOC family protein [Shewanella]MBR9728475.1 VOC family protein [Shewanella intestini]MRG36294.1 VOC family protein [Shewanella sp. XMDDZSB0408]